MLEARGLEISPDQRARILQCLELELLEGWLRRAVSVTATQDLFG
ncbi:MAG TPA: hypothetical protein VGI10_16600 [Polyangiaceae bacterium]